jgi:hypothetical protein
MTPIQSCGGVFTNLTFCFYPSRDFRDGDVARLERLFDASPTPDINHSHFEFGPPLHLAAWCNNFAAVNLLLAAGADPLIGTCTE